MRGAAVRLLCCCLSLCGAAAHAVDLPALCADEPLAPDLTTPVAELRMRVLAQTESDPKAAVRLMCMTIPRVAREYGEDSAELAWWIGSLATPMIAYLDKHAEAVPLLQFAQPILEREFGANAAEVADIHVAYAWIYYRQGRLADAGAAWQQALQIRERFPGERKIELQKVLVGLALVRQGQGDFTAARECLARARDILTQNNDLVSEAAAAIENVLTNVALREDNFRDAKQHAEAQVRIEKQLQGGAPQLVPAYALLGQILARLDDFKASEAASREAIRLSESDHGPLQRHYFSALTQLGLLLNERGRPGEALGFAQRAVEVGERTLGSQAPRLVRALQSLADVHRSLGHLPEALHIYERIGTIVQSSRTDIERPALVAYYRGLANLQLDLGNFEDASSALNAGLESASAESSLVVQRAFLTATLAQSVAREDPATSHARLVEAMNLFASRLPPSHPAILQVVNQICSLEISEGSAATPNCNAADRRIARGRQIDPALRAAVYDNLSELAQKRGDLKRAADLAISAVAAAEGLGTPDPLWKSYFRTARVLNRRGDPALAIFFGKRSIAQIERQRKYFRGDDEMLDRGYLHDKVAVYRAVADWLMETGRINEGIEVLQLLKSEELYDLTSRGIQFGLPGGDGPDLDGIEQSLHDRYLKTRPDEHSGDEIERLTRLRDKARITAEERKLLESLLEQQGDLETVTARRIRKFVAENGEVRDADHRDVREIRAERLTEEIRRAPERSAIAVYLLTDNRLRLLIATRTSQSEVRIPLDAQLLRQDIGHFLDSIAGRENVDGASRALYELIARPLDEAARRENVTHLILWLDGAMRYVPFGALRGPDGYLADRYAIQVLTGARRDPVPAFSPTGPGPNVRGLGVTQAVGGYQPLPAMADELCYVVHGPIAGLATKSAACPRPANAMGAMSGEGFADAEFTAARLARLLQVPHGYSVLHLGTHFNLRPGNAMRSYLVLGDGSRLMLDALGAFDFTGLDLVTLSACQTAMGGARTDDGREVEGLSAIVQQRGARRVVASLWAVEDESTAQLMRVMYQALAIKPSDVAGALQEAQHSVRSLQHGSHSYDHPYYWAGFVVSGSGF
ncbi:MAG TPA: CHAT domain-containing tetratricopeptide repeat protein [Steroidobacteraceae bacterium]|nr:CHAT domain-containing tetratricopeptide repeat protein [Steroidobacteraceae bacterium]